MKLPDVEVRTATLSDIPELVAGFERSAEELEPWVFPPKDLSRFVKGKIAGYFKYSAIIRGALQQAFLGYAAFSFYRRKGFMSAAFNEVLRFAFEQLELHRIEANIQPANKTSKKLVKRNGFIREGFSKDYLRINGVWRDHERWAMTRERWDRLQAGD